jgi:hypothetical protein
LAAVAALAFVPLASLCAGGFELGQLFIGQDFAHLLTQCSAVGPFLAAMFAHQLAQFAALLLSQIQGLEHAAHAMLAATLIAALVAFAHGVELFGLLGVKQFADFGVQGHASLTSVTAFAAAFGAHLLTVGFEQGIDLNLLVTVQFQLLGQALGRVVVGRGQYGCGQNQGTGGRQGQGEFLERESGHVIVS